MGRRILQILFVLGAGGIGITALAGGVGYVAAHGRLPGFVENPLDLASPEARVPEARMYASIQPRDARAQLQLGVELMRSGDEAGALAALEQALTLEPVPAAVHARLAMLYQRAGRRGEAREQGRAALAGGAPLPRRLRRQLALPEEGS